MFYNFIKQKFRTCSKFLLKHHKDSSSFTSKQQTIRRKLSTKPSTCQQVNSNENSFCELATLLEQNKDLFQHKIKLSIPNILSFILFCIVSVGIIISILFTYDSISYHYPEKIVFIIIILIYSIINIIIKIKTYKEEKEKSQVTLHNTVCVLRYNAEKAQFPLSVDTVYPPSSDSYSVYRNLSWQSIPSNFLIPGDILDVTGREIPPWCRKLSDNAYKLYPRKSNPHFPLSESISNLSQTASIPNNMVLPENKPTLCVVQQAPVLFQNTNVDYGKSDVTKMKEFFFYVFIVVLIVIMIISFAADKKDLGLYFTITLIPSLIMFSPNFLWILRKIGIYLVEKVQFKDIVEEKENDLHETSSSSSSTDFSSTDSSSFWAHPERDEDAVEVAFYLPKSTVPIRSIALDAPERLAMINCLVFPQFHPTFFASSIYIDSFIIFTNEQNKELLNKGENNQKENMVEEKIENNNDDNQNVNQSNEEKQESNQKENVQDEKIENKNDENQNMNDASEEKQDNKQNENLRDEKEIEMDDLETQQQESNEQEEYVIIEDDKEENKDGDEQKDYDSKIDKNKNNENENNDQNNKFEEHAEIIDAKNSLGLVPDLNSPDLQKYSSQLGPLTFAAIAGKWDMSIFEPFFLEMKDSKWPLVTKALSLFGETQHTHSEFNARRIMSIMNFEKTEITNIYLVHRSTECSIVSKGSPKIVLNMCSKYWNGKEVKELTQEMKENLKKTINEAKKMNDGTCVCLSQQVVDYDFSIDKKIVSHEHIPESVTDQTFLGVIVFSSRVVPEAEEFQEDLTQMGVRFAIFSNLRARESLESMGKMGLSTDFNCIIDLNDQSPSDVYDKLDTLNTHMPVGINQLIEYVQQYDSIPLTIPLYINPTEESMQSVLTLRESKGQKICVVTDPLTTSGIALTTQYPFISYDTHLFSATKNEENLKSSAIAVRALNELISLPSLIHLSETTTVNLLSDLLKESKSVEMKMKSTLLTYFILCLFFLFIPISFFYKKDEMQFSYVFLISFVIICFTPLLIMLTPLDNKILKKHRVTEHIYPKSLVIMNFIIFFASLIAFHLWNILSSINKPKTWDSVLLILLFAFSSIILPNLHQMKFCLLSKNYKAIILCILFDLIILIVHIYNGFVNDTFDYTAVISAFCILVLSFIVEFVSKKLHKKAEDERQMLLELDFNTRLGAFSPEQN